jgi:aminoglycoside phosphotransferase (APT) family kinase protein
VTQLPSGAAAWLATHGVAGSSARRIGGARTGELFVVEGHVLRWYGRTTFLEQEPDAVAREVAALSALEATSVPAPRLVAWSLDPPALLTTMRPGRNELDARDTGAILATLDAIHATQPGRLASWSYRGYHEGRDLPRPVWWQDEAAWVLAIGWSKLASATADPVLIHRDFHPGNLLWSGGAISGVVDWGNACVGPAAFDLAHYRVNLATLFGPEVADARLPGDPAWDIEAALGFIDPWDTGARDTWVGPWPHTSAEEARSRLEEFVTRALALLR